MGLEGRGLILIFGEIFHELFFGDLAIERNGIQNIIECAASDFVVGGDRNGVVAGGGLLP